MKRLLIAGGGISGLIANWVFRKGRDWDITIVEARTVGGDFTAGGLRYIHRTEEMVEMLHDLRLVYTNYTVQGGILLQGKVRPYPAHVQNLPKEEARRIQHDHYRKTRRTEPDSFASKSMNDPESVGARGALRCDPHDVVQALAARATKIVADVIERIEPGRVRLKSGASLPFDFLITTLPLWIARRLFWFPLPEALAMKLNVVTVEHQRNPYARWDYVYTPYTPEDLVHRISPNDGGTAVEFNGEWEDDTNDRLTSDLNFLFPDGWTPLRVVKGANGHLLPLESKPSWPDNVRPLGRFAQWNPRATSDVVLKESINLFSEWNK